MKNLNKIKIGKIGENLAEKFLISKNYQILGKNYYTRHGEIDLITFDQSTGEYAFVEVKTRTNQNFGEPQESINFHKKNHLIKTIFHYIDNHIITNKKTTYFIWRLDLIAVKLDLDYHQHKIDHIKNILNG